MVQPSIASSRKQRVVSVCSAPGLGARADRAAPRRRRLHSVQRLRRPPRPGGLKGRAKSERRGCPTTLQEKHGCPLSVAQIDGDTFQGPVGPSYTSPSGKEHRRRSGAELAPPADPGIARDYEPLPTNPSLLSRIYASQPYIVRASKQGLTIMAVMAARA